MLMNAFVTSRMDYCNMMYVVLPLKITQELQLVQNAAAHVLIEVEKWGPTQLIHGIYDD